MMITNKEKQELNKHRKHYLTMQQNQQEMECLKRIKEFIINYEHKYINTKN